VKLHYEQSRDSRRETYRGLGSATDCRMGAVWEMCGTANDTHENNPCYDDCTGTVRTSTAQNSLYRTKTGKLSAFDTVTLIFRNWL
jgi:hypothetical protein